MKFIVERENLLEGLRIVQPGIGGQRENSILGNLLLESKGSSLYLTSTDSEINIKTEIDINGEIDGSITLPAKKLSEIIREIDRDIISINTDGKSKVVISTDRLTYSLNGLSKDNFPVFPTLSRERGLSLSVSLLTEAIKKVVFAVASDNTRHTLNGVCFLFKEREVVIVALDGHRLALIKRELQDSMEEYGIILPVKILKVILHIFRSDKIIDIFIFKNQVGIRDNKTTVVSKLITGKFPDYRLIIPTDQENKRIRLKTKEFLNVCRRVAIMTSERSNILRIHLNRDCLSINANSPDFGEAREDIKIPYRGDETEIGFNPRYLLDAIGAIDEEEVDFFFGGPKDPCVLETIDNNQLNMVMPVEI